MTENEDLELYTLAKMVCKELFNNGCTVKYAGFPYELISDFPRRVSSGVDVSFMRDNANCTVQIERSVFDTTIKQFVFDLIAEYILTEEQIPSLSSLNIGDKIIILGKLPNGVTLRLRHAVSSDVVAECEAKYSDEAEIAAVAKAIVSRIVEEMNKI